MAAMPLAVAGTIAGTAMSAKAASDQGVVQENSMQWQAYGMRRQAAEEEDQAVEAVLQAQQEEANRMAQLSDMLGTNVAGAAAGGITSDSASVEAVNSRAREVADIDIGRIMYMGTSRAAKLRRQARTDRDAAGMYEVAGGQARNAANAAMWGTIIKGATSLAMYASMPTMGGAGGGGGSPAAGAMPHGARPV